MNITVGQFDAKTLKRAFLKVLGGTVLGAVFLNAAVDIANRVEDSLVKGGIPLSSHEQALVQGIFGDEVDSSIVRKHLKFDPSVAYGTVSAGSRRHINFFSKFAHTDDYATGGHEHRNRFIHEMVHIWQNQHSRGFMLDSFTKCGEYRYTLDQDSDFDQFCFEEQAQIVTDYAAKFLYPLYWRMPAEQLENEADANLLRVVEGRFPEARKTRRRMEHIYAGQAIDKYGVSVTVPEV